MSAAEKYAGSGALVAASAASTNPDVGGALREVLQQVGPGPFNVGFLYLSDHFATHADELRAAVHKELRLEALTGTIGMSVCSERGELFDRPGVVLLALRLPKGSFRSFCLPAAQPPELPERMPWEGNTGVTFLHTDSRLGHLLLEPQHLGDSFFVGGLTASRNLSLQLHEGGVEDGGATGLMVSDQVALHCAVTQGCRPIGPEHVVTESQGGVITKLDGKPALAVLKEEIGAEWPKGLRHILIGVPLPQRDLEEYVVRAWAGIDERQQAFAVGHDLPEGSRIFLVRRDAEAAREDMQRMLRTVVERRREPPRAGVYYSCLARGPFLFGEPGVELGLIRERLGEFPLVGVSCDGEISHDQLYTHTGVLTLFY